MTRQFTFSLVFSPSELERRYYVERVATIMVMTEQGLRLQLPLRRLQPFITKLGIRGRFLLTLDEQNSFISLQKLAEL